MDIEYVMPEPGAPDAEALFEEGCRALAEGREEAQELFERAVALAGSAMLWRIVDPHVEEFDVRAAKWMRRAVRTLGVPGGIEVHPGTLRIVVRRGEPESQYWEIEVRSFVEDRAAVVRALEAAKRRIMRVAHDGRELSDAELEAEYEAGGYFYTPNYIAVERDPVPRIWMDCKDGIMPHMSRTVIAVVIEELAAAGVRRAGLCTGLTPKPS
ncbi:hypothetical protein [Kitasatospora sp. NPDC004289]